MRKLILIFAAIVLFASCGKTTSVRIINERPNAAPDSVLMTDVMGDSCYLISKDLGDIYDVVLYGYSNGELTLTHEFGNVKKNETTEIFELDKYCDEIKVKYINNRKISLYYPQSGVLIEDPTYLWIVYMVAYKEISFNDMKRGKINRICIKE